MLRVIQNKSAAGAKSYYTAGLLHRGTGTQWPWRGEGTRRLGLDGDVDQARGMPCAQPRPEKRACR